MKIVYIAHPISGAVEANKIRISEIGRELFLQGEVIPFCPYFFTLSCLDDNHPRSREIGMRSNEELFKRKAFDQLWLYGDRVTTGMKREVALAEKYGIIVVPKTDETSDWYLSHIADE